MKYLPLQCLALLIALLIAMAACLLSACANEPSARQPLPVTPPPMPPLSSIATTQHIDLSQPLSADALAAIAVYGNPELIALRASEEIAEAQVFAAGLFPDPSFTFGLDAPTNGDAVSSALFLGLGIDFAALARRPVEIRGAQANLQAVHFDIAWSEWLTGEQARLLALRISHLRQISALTAQLRALAEAGRNRSVLAAARGDLPASALQTSRLAAADAADRDRSAELQLRTAELDLNRLLGIAPQERLQIAPPPPPVTELPPEEVLYQCALSTRTDLTALRAAYDGAQATMDIAQLGRYPLPTLDINAARDTSRIKTIGPGINFTLPLWNRGRGEVAVADATAAQLRADYLARLATIRADLAAALASLQITQLQYADVAKEMLPLLPQADAYDRASARGDLSLAAANEARMALLDKQIVAATLSLAMAELEIALEVSVGRPLENI